MAKRLCCGFRGKIYYTDVNEKEGMAHCIMKLHT